MEPLVYTVSSLSKALETSPDTIYKMVQRREIPHVRMGEKKLVFPKDEIAAWLSTQSLKGAR